MKKFFADFKVFITRGNILDLAVGVIIGGAFNAIVNALAAILVSVATWRVPGGIKGLVTVLPAANDIQEGIDGIGQTFSVDKYNEYALKIGTDAGITDTGSAMIYGKSVLDAKYTLYGKKFVYNLSAKIDWGTFINAIISFLIIALTLFIIVKVAAAMARKREAAKAKIEEEKYKRWAEAHPEEAAALEAKKAKEAEEAGKPVVDPVVALLEEIRDSLKKDEAKPDAE